MRNPYPANVPKVRLMFSHELISFARRLENGEDVQNIIRDMRIRSGVLQGMYNTAVEKGYDVEKDEEI